MRYQVRAGVQWAVDRAGVTLANRDGSALTLGYPEAAIWDLLSRGSAFPRIVSLTGRIASLEPEPAEALVRSTLEDWTRAGFLDRGD